MGVCFSKASSRISTRDCHGHGYGYNSCCKDQSFMNSCCHVKAQSGTDSIAQVSAPNSKINEEEEERRRRRSHGTSIDQSSITPSLAIRAEKKSPSSATVPPPSSAQKVEAIAVAGGKLSAKECSLQLHCGEKKSDELAIANAMNANTAKIIRASSPRKNPILCSLLAAPNSAPGVTKTDSTRSASSLYRRKGTDHEEEDDNDDNEEGEDSDEEYHKFRPSQARKLWLSEVQALTLPACRKSSLETLNKGKTVSSRTNSFSRILDPVVEVSSKNTIKASASASARPASYNSAPLLLRRSPSANDSANGDEGGARLCRNPSGKTHRCTDQMSSSNINEAVSHGSLGLQQKTHTSITTTHHNKHSLSTELTALDSSTSNSMAHKRTSSRDSAPLKTSHELSMDSHAMNIRRPSPPKKNASLSSSDAIAGSRPMVGYSSRRPVASSIKAEPSSNPNHKSQSSDPDYQSQEHGLSDSVARSGVRSLVQKSSSQVEIEVSNHIASNGNRNSLTRKEKSPLKKKEKSPLRRACIHGATPTSNSSFSSTTPKTINADRSAPELSNDDVKSKDPSIRTKRLTTRLPLKEISDNSTNHVLPNPKHIVKDSMRVKMSDEKTEILKETSNCNVANSMKANTIPNNHEVDVKTTVLDLGQDFAVGSKDPLEVKAESLVMGGKSVLSAFRALEEYRLKYSNLNLELGKDVSHDDDDVLYSRPHHKPNAREKESFSQPLAQGESTKGRDPHEIHENIPQHDEQAKEDSLLTKSRSANKRSCEPFLFPDVQSLIMMPESLDDEESSMKGGAVRATMPASISKACSILKAVADLNKGTCVLYPQRKEKPLVEENYIERPNLLSFQFGEGDSHRVTTG